MIYITSKEKTIEELKSLLKKNSDKNTIKITESEYTQYKTSIADILDPDHIIQNTSIVQTLKTYDGYTRNISLIKDNESKLISNKYIGIGTIHHTQHILKQFTNTTNCKYMEYKTSKETITLSCYSTYHMKTVLAYLHLKESITKIPGTISLINPQLNDTIKTNDEDIIRETCRAHNNMPYKLMWEYT